MLNSLANPGVSKKWQKSFLGEIPLNERSKNLPNEHFVFNKSFSKPILFPFSLKSKTKQQIKWTAILAKVVLSKAFYILLMFNISIILFEFLVLDPKLKCVLFWNFTLQMIKYIIFFFQLWNFFTIKIHLLKLLIFIVVNFLLLFVGYFI